MKKLFGCILSLVVAVMLVFTPAEHVYAQGLGLSVSSSSVAVGKTVKVTVSMPSGYFGTVVISSSDEGVLSNGGDGVANIGDAAGYSTSQSFSFTAKAVGSCTIKAYCTVVGDAEGNDAGGTITGASTKVTVTSASSNNDSNSNKDNSGSNTGNDSNANKDNENKEEKKSSNASLGSLVISAGTLSPEFSAATKDYTATVDYSCSSLAVTANPADSKASVTSVKGNDSLEVGENTVSVVVTAEDGSTSTYNIVVTRRAEDDPENADKQDNWKKFDINGTEWTMVNDIPEDVVPEGFEHSKTVIDGLEYNTLHGTFGDITLVYLQSESGNGLFVYDAAQNTAYEFVRINSESHFIVVLLPKVDDVPEGYNEISLSIEGKGVATAYQTKVEKSDDQTKDFYLVYAINDNGESGWYTYDSVDGTYMRTELSTPTVAQEENDTTKSELVPGIANKYLVLAAILVLVIVILLLLLIVSAVKNRKYKAMDYHDDVDDAAEDVSNEALEETTDETADEIADELEEEVTEEPLDEVAEEAAEETADEAVEEPADEVAESPGPSVSKLVPHVKDTAKILYGIYIAITICEATILRALGMPLFDSLTTTFGTVGTGGFGIRNDSIAGYSPAIQITITVFMILSGINYTAYFYILTGKIKELFKIEEVRWYLAIIFGSVAVITWNVRSLYPTFSETLRHAFFQVGSIIRLY